MNIITIIIIIIWVCASGVAAGTNLLIIPGDASGVPFILNAWAVETGPASFSRTSVKLPAFGPEHS